MQLVSITPSYFGPFLDNQTLKIEPDITVITGANDSGKTKLLDIIERIPVSIRSTEVLSDVEVNSSIFGVSKSWREDTRVGCRVRFARNEHSSQYFGSATAPGANGDHYEAVFSFAPAQLGIQKMVHHGKSTQSAMATGSFKSLPSIIRLDRTGLVNTLISLEKPAPADVEFLRAGFGPEFNSNALLAMSHVGAGQLVSKAEAKLNGHLESVFPQRHGFRIQLRDSLENKTLRIYLEDAFLSGTATLSRGTGVQKLIGVVCRLASQINTKEQFIVLFDEPESSLHADSQRALRKLLESLSDRSNVQVIYTTHSPAMINSWRSNSLRLITREVDAENGHGFSAINNDPARENFGEIRSELGIHACDSLLFGPLTIIVEGPTETISLPILLKKLSDSGIAGFEDAAAIWSQSYLLDGSGDSIEYFCHITQQQGSKPLILFDGEKKEQYLNKIRKKCPDVPIVLLDKGEEFEQLVPKSHYFGALAEYLGHFVETNNIQESFDKWESGAETPSQLAFTKRIERWMDEAFPDIPYRKPDVMRIASETVSPSDIKNGRLGELLISAKRELNS